MTKQKTKLTFSKERKITFLSSARLTRTKCQHELKLPNMERQTEKIQPGKRQRQEQ